jgi:pyruvate/2-oxoglutarate/acetoin dehydrogenase E1 component
VGVHRAMEAAASLQQKGISAAVLDLRTVSPLDASAILDTVGRTGRLVVVDEDYEGFGLSGEVAALALEAGLSFRYARVCTRSTIPYSREREDHVLPNTERIRAAAERLVGIG